MEPLIKDLETILENELVLHEQLLDAAKKMNRAIKAEELAKVKESRRLYDELTCQIETLEEKRLVINDALAKSLKIENHPNLLRIINKLPDNRKEKLSKLRTDLKSTIEELKRTNSSNQILLTESLRTIAKIFQFIDSSRAKPSGYKYQGKKASVLINRTIINTIA
jgi:flagellar biosynthesis/type III secretory pathway chaperone